MTWPAMERLFGHAYRTWVLDTSHFDAPLNILCKRIPGYVKHTTALDIVQAVLGRLCCNSEGLSSRATILEVRSLKNERHCRNPSWMRGVEGSTEGGVRYGGIGGRR